VTYAAFGLSLVAILVSLGSLYYTHRADRRAARAERAGRRARIIIEPRGYSTPDRYQFAVRNVGAVPARGVQVWLTDRGGHERLSSLSSEHDVVLIPGEPAKSASVLYRVDPELIELDVWAAWTDDEGRHEERLGPRPD
jgi:hypothetical protein